MTNLARKGMISCIPIIVKNILIYRLNSEVTRNQQYRTESFKNMNISILKPLINERPFTFNNNQDNSKE
jgi:cellulose synthase/poly-beta-1,6-N-acetylglucosamine synthase-like glycosyltransferase